MLRQNLNDVPAEWAKRAWIDQAKYKADVYPFDLGPERLLGRASQAPRLDEGPHQNRKLVIRARQHLDQMVRGRRLERRLELHRPPSAHPRRPDRDHLGVRRSLAIPTHHLSAVARRSLQDGQTSCAPATSRRATGSRSTICRSSPKPPTRSWPARGSAPFTWWCSQASRPTALPSASATANPRWLSPPMKACAAARRCR